MLKKLNFIFNPGHDQPPIKFQIYEDEKHFMVHSEGQFKGSFRLHANTKHGINTKDKYLLDNAGLFGNHFVEQVERSKLIDLIWEHWIADVEQAESLSEEIIRFQLHVDSNTEVLAEHLLIVINRYGITNHLYFILQQNGIDDPLIIEVNK